MGAGWSAQVRDGSFRSDDLPDDGRCLTGTVSRVVKVAVNVAVTERQRSWKSPKRVGGWQGCGVAEMEYEIRVAGEVPPDTLAALVEARLTRQGVETILRGPVVDQAALVGIVNWLQMLGIELREIRQAGSDRPDVESTYDLR
jgi:hypothetical protein